MSKSEIKKLIFWSVAWIITLINFSAFIVSRNLFWISHPGQAWLAAGVTENRTYLASEFERNLSCYQPLTCLRSGGAFISQFLIDATTLAAELVSVDLNIEQRTFIILLVGVLWRVFCIGVFLLTMTRLFNSLKASVLLTNTLMFVLSGLPLWMLGRFLVNLPLGLSEATTLRANDAFFWMSYQDLFFYDYGFIALIPLIIFMLSAYKNKTEIPVSLLVLSGFLIATFYEAFVPLIILSGVLFIWKIKRQIKWRLLWLVVGQAIWTIARAFSIRFSEPSDLKSPYFRDTSFRSVLSIFGSKNTHSTKDSLPSIAIQLAIIIFVALVISLLGAIISIILNIRTPIPRQKIIAINSTTLATLMIISGGYLTPKLVELGRQSLGLTVAMVIFGFFTTQNMIEKFRVKQQSHNLTTTE